MLSHFSLHFYCVVYASTFTDPWRSVDAYAIFSPGSRGRPWLSFRTSNKECCLTADAAASPRVKRRKNKNSNIWCFARLVCTCFKYLVNLFVILYVVLNLSMFCNVLKHLNATVISISSSSCLPPSSIFSLLLCGLFFFFFLYYIEGALPQCVLYG